MLKKGFTLLEILLVVAVITILAGIVILAINPGRQLAMARDAQRESDIKVILEGVYQYSIDHQGILPTPITTVETEICKIQNIAKKSEFNSNLLLAEIDNEGDIFNIRSSCLKNEVLASEKEVEPIREILCKESGIWDIMQIDEAKKLSGIGYGCQIEDQLRNEKFGHRVCKQIAKEESDFEKEKSEEEIREREKLELEEKLENEEGDTISTTNLEQDVSNETSDSARNCIDLSSLIDREKYLFNLPEDPKNTSRTGIGYFILKSKNNRVTISAPYAEQTSDLRVTR